MRAQLPSYPHLLRNDLAKTSECKSIFGTLALALVLPLLFAACGPQGESTTKNYYQTQMSGGGATKDPGDGTGGATGDGGGGQGVQCEDGSLYVRDVYEAIFEKERVMKTVSGEKLPEKVSIEARKILTDSLKKYFGPSSQILRYVTDDYWIDVENRITFLDESRELRPSQDANSPIRLKAGCRIVQIAYWDESSRNVKDDRLYVSRKLWSKLDQINKIALLAHEIFFKQAREAGYKNSDAIRDQIGQLLSVKGLESLFPDWIPSTDSKVSSILPASMNGFKVCDGTSTEDTNARVRLYQYEGKDGKQHFSFPVIKSNKINGAILQGATTSFSLEGNNQLAAGTDLWIVQTNINEESFERFNSDYLDRWYSNSGLLTKTQYTRDLISIAGTNKTIWSALLYSSAEPIKISISNSVLSWNGFERTKLRPSQELIAEINLDLKYKLERCSQSLEQTEGAIALLHREIKDSIKRGKYPTKFPAWAKALSKLPNSKDHAEDCTYMLNDARVISKYPALLYSIYLKTNTELSTQEVMGSNAFSPKPYDAFPLGKVTLSQGAEEITLTLRCEDYKTQYANIATASVKKGPQLNFNKTVIRAINKNDLALLTDTEIIAIQKFQDFLSQKESKTAIESFKTFYTPYDQNRTYGGNFSPDERHFMSELYSEKSIRLTACDQYIDTRSRAPMPIDYIGTACIVVTMESSKNSYMTYVSFYQSEREKNIEVLTPELEFVRFYPPQTSSPINP